MARGIRERARRGRRRRHHRHRRAGRRLRAEAGGHGVHRRRHARSATRSARCEFPGNRELVKTFAAFTAIDMVRRMLLHRRRRRLGADVATVSQSSHDGVRQAGSPSVADSGSMPADLTIAVRDSEAFVAPTSAMTRRGARRSRALEPHRAARRPPRVTWVADEAAHVTLRFIGEVLTRRRARDRGALQTPLDPARRSTSTGAALGTFPGGRRPRVVWIGAASGGDGRLALAAPSIARLEPIVGPARGAAVSRRT